MAKTARKDRPIIAITGSAGKSTTKEMVASILSRKWNVFKSKDNLNFYTHTRQYAKQIRPNHRAAVLEYGMSGAGHIKLHCLAIQPNFSVITNIGSAHIGAFGGSVKKLALAKSEIIRWMKPTGTVVLNQDDANTKLINKGRFHGRTLTVGIDNPADYRAKNVHYATNGMAFDVLLHGRNEQFSIPIYGRHHVYNALCAIAVADTLGFSAAQIRTGLRSYLRMRRRMSIYRYPGKIIIIDDSYSSNPHAARSAIDTLTHIGTGTKIAVLGSMQALGSYTVKGHNEVGRHLAKKRISRLYTYGAAAKRIGTAAVNAGFPAKNVVHFATKAALHGRLIKDLVPNTTILLKASHGLGLMETADLLRRRLAARKPATPNRIRKVR